jgi:Rieske Fe-S protein
MNPSQESRPVPSRRTVVTAAGTAGLAAALTACGGSGDAAGDSGTSKSASSDAGSSSAAPLAKVSDIPEGGGKIFADQQVVVTQPKKGDFKAFSSKCTHMGCAVADVSGGTINCPCHGSKFSIEDGSVKNPPATQPLPEKQIEVSGDSIKLA